MIRDCKIDPERLAAVKACMATYDQEGHAPGSEWPWNVISNQAVAYSCGRISRGPTLPAHEHDPAEFALCQKLSAEVAAIMDRCNVGMGSEAGDPFHPFFVVAFAGSTPPKKTTEAFIRDAFGGTIYPPTAITIEPLQERGEWWKQVLTDGEGIDDYLEPWRKMIHWFHSQPELTDAVFVMIGDDPLDDEFKNGGCVFPRLALGLTSAGSLVGIGGWTVHT